MHLRGQWYDIYTTKIMESVCVCVCVCVYVCMSGYAFRHASRYEAETLHGGRGRAHEVCGHIFEATRPEVKGHSDWRVCVYMYVCPAMRFVMLRGMKLKLCMGVGDGPTRFVGIFSKRPDLRSKVIQRSICLRNALWLPNLVRRASDQSIGHCWGQRSCRGHQGSTRGQIA